jgi:ankyrin repeat protein
MGAACASTGVRHADRLHFRNERPALPLAYLADWMGARGYDRTSAGRITFRLHNRDVTLQIDSTDALIKGRPIQLRSEPFDSAGVAYLPVESVRSVFWTDPTWDSRTGQVTVIDPRTERRLVLSARGPLREDPTAEYAALYGAADLAGIEQLLGDEPVRITQRFGEWEEEYGVTLLHMAARHGHIEVAQMLLDRGADVHDAQITLDEDAEDAVREAALTPLHLAVRHNHRAMVQLLLARGADVNAASTYAVPRGKNPKNVHNGVTPLKLAAQCGYEEMVELLLERGADPNLAAAGGEPADYPPVQLSALMWAARYNDLGIARKLLQHGAQTEPRDWLGWTALSWAARYGNDEMVELLLAHKADVNAPDRSGLTPRRWAAQHGFTQTAALLARHGGEE